MTTVRESLLYIQCRKYTDVWCRGDDRLTTYMYNSHSSLPRSGSSGYGTASMGRPSGSILSTLPQVIPHRLGLLQLLNAFHQSRHHVAVPSPVPHPELHVALVGCLLVCRRVFCGWYSYGDLRLYTGSLPMVSLRSTFGWKKNSDLYQGHLCQRKMHQSPSFLFVTSVSVSGNLANIRLDMANAVFNSVSDLLILALPIPVVWNLALTRRKKITLSLVFAMGSAGCIVSIIRLRSIIAYLEAGDGDLTYTILDFVLWSSIEAAVSMMCACVPTLKPFFETHFRGMFGSTQDSKHTGQYFRTDERQTDHSRKGSNLDPFRGDIEMNRHKNKAQITANNVESDTDSMDEILNQRPSIVEDHIIDDRIMSGIVVSHSYQVRTAAGV